MSPQEQDLIRWCYLIGGLSRSRLARDFQTTVERINEIVSTDLARVLNLKVTDATRVVEFGLPLPQQERTRKNFQLYRQVLSAI